jgi:hypothetical protein
MSAPGGETVKRRYFALGLLLLLSGPTLSVAGDKGLVFAIKPDKERYAAGERISIGLQFTNNGVTPIQLNTWLFFHPQMVEAIVAGPEGSVPKTVHVSYDMLMPRESDYRTLRPGEAWATQLSSAPQPYHLLGHELSKSGVYTIRLVYENETDTFFIPGGKGPIRVPNVFKGKVKSNLISIEMMKK